MTENQRVSDYSDLNIRSLDRMLDQTKSEMYARKFAAFYGPLLASLNFFWAPDIGTAAVDGVNLMWNPYWFLWLTPQSRLTVLMHELLHCAWLHFIRLGDREPRLWNYATDIKINNKLINDEYDFTQLQNLWFDSTIPLDMPEEDIYDELIRRAQSVPLLGSFGQVVGALAPKQPNGTQGNGNPFDTGGDLFQTGTAMTLEEQAKAVANVVRASQQAKLSGGGDMPGDTSLVLQQFLAPVVAWEALFHRFFQEMEDRMGSTWAKPNRRYQDIYLPSYFEEEGLLSHLIYFEDTSGSITDKDALRFNSEFKYVKEHYKPKKMTLVQFDTIIQDVHVYEEEDPFEQIKIKGRGGTSLECVREYILEHKPTCAVVFSDLQCDPMAPLGFEIPIIWVCISNRAAQVPFGQLIHIR